VPGSQLYRVAQAQAAALQGELARAHAQAADLQRAHAAAAAREGALQLQARRAAACARCSARCGVAGAVSALRRRQAAPAGLTAAPRAGPQRANWEHVTAARAAGRAGLPGSPAPVQTIGARPPGAACARARGSLQRPPGVRDL